MKNERMARGTKMARMEERWAYRRFGIDEEPTNSIINKKPADQLNQEGRMQRDWIYKRFGIEER